MIPFKLLFGCVGIALAGAGIYEGDVVLEALPESEEHILILQGLDKQYSLDFWYPESVGRLQPDVNFQVHVLAEEKYDVVKGLLDAGMMFRIMHRNLDKMIDVSHAAVASTSSFDRGEVESYNYNVYHKMNQIYNWADKMAGNAANKITKKSIGSTHLGNDLFVFIFDELTGVENPPKIFMDCGMHAREWISHAFCQYFVDQLANPDSKFAHLRKGIEWHIMPVVNPDGYIHSWEHDRFWRKNRNPNTDEATKAAQKTSKAHNRDCGTGKGVGVDLNRNYDAMWQLGDDMVGASKWCKDQSYQGASAFSEKESIAQSNYIKSIMPKSYLTIHAYAQVVLFPYTWTRDAERPHNYDELFELSAEITRRIGGSWRHGQGRDIFYPAAGGSDDWAHKEGVDIVYTFELRDKGNYGFMLPEFLIRPAVEECARGISAVYDHLVGASDEESKETEVKIPRQTKCKLNPDEAYIGDRELPEDLTPTFACTALTGKCKVKCPDGAVPKLKKASCKRFMGEMAWKPEASRYAKVPLCAEGLSVMKHSNYITYCGSIRQTVTSTQMSNVEKKCSMTGKKMKCSLKCNGMSVINTIKMTKNGPSAGTKKTLTPVCELIAKCN